jgi:acetyl esterase/lipase
MSDRELFGKLQGFPPIYILMAENDDITRPATNERMLAERLTALNQKIPQHKQEIKFTVHCYGTPISHCLDAKPVVLDLLKIAQS